MIKLKKVFYKFFKLERIYYLSVDVGILKFMYVIICLIKVFIVIENLYYLKIKIYI